ncbi:MAG: stage II sporulation protein M [Candidatus Dormibacteria bacterium]
MTRSIFRRLFGGVRPPRRRMAALVAARDLAESVSDVRLAVSMTSLTFLIPLIATGGVSLAYRLLGPNSREISVRLIEVGAFFVVFLPASFSLVLALESFSGERERNTLEMLFATPLRESEIYLGKMFGVLLPSLGLSYSALLVYTVAVFASLHFVPTAILAPLVVVAAVQAVVMVSGATIVSSQTKTLRSANVMASFIIIPMSGVIQGESILIISRLEWVLWGVAAGLAIVALLLLRLGMVGFNRESILAKESRPPDARSWLRHLRPGRSLRPGRLPGEVLAALVRCRGAIAASAILLVGGIVLGVATNRLALVPAQPVVQLVRTQATAGHEVVSGGSHLFAFILGHNLLVGLVMLLLAPLTIGVAGGLLTLLNGFVIGYLGAVFAGLRPHGLWVFLCGTVPHGVVELPALVLASAIALRVGASMVRPAPEGWLSGMRSAGADYLRVLLLLVPMFTVAALIESFVTPSILRGCG